MSEGIVMKGIPGEMAEACLPQSQPPGCGADERSGDQAQIGLMADQETATTK